MRQSAYFRVVASLILLVFISELFFPYVLLALTSGPYQPEFTNFQGGGSQLVNPFNGAFNYSIPVVSVPGPHGSGYSMALGYDSNVSPEEDASWVGYGWSLNPGSIVRSKNGTADDMDGETVIHYNKVKPMETWTVGASSSLEILDIEGIGSTLSAGGQISLRHNNYKGWSLAGGLSTAVSGIGNLGMNIDEDKTSFSAKISPIGIINRLAKITGASNQQSMNGILGFLDFLNFDNVGVGGSLTSNAPTTRPTSVMPYEGDSWSINPGVHLAAFLSGTAAGLSGSHTVVTPKAQYTKTHYGYMYSSNAKSSYDVMDYYVEKDKEYKGNVTRFLGVPFSGADQFSVSGQGVGGVFRLRQRQAGTFRPNYEESTIDIIQVGAELILGNDIGIGGNIGEGEAKLTTEIWDNNNGVYQFGNTSSSVDEGESSYFRFYNDMGGSISYANQNTDVPAQAWESGYFYRGGAAPSMNRGKRNKRATYIGYHTNSDMQKKNTTSGNGVYYKAYTKGTTGARELVNRTSEGVFQQGIGEFAIQAGNGNQYVYGLPVYARNEVSMAYGVSQNAVNTAEGRAYAQVSLSARPEQMTGEERRTPYASTYLLTQVTTPDYVDRTSDGPTSDDFGGYTVFNYVRAYGGNNKVQKIGGEEWYKWRTPYTGLAYQRGTLSDSRDNLGIVSYGEKEVYYPESIETKTHIAFFITNKTSMSRDGITLEGSGTERLDAFEAEHTETTAAGEPTSFPITENKQCYLERIQLYSKKEDGSIGTLLQTTHFVYDYSLMPNQPNSRSKAGGGRYGKLTLKKVWVENQDVVQATIAPYQFEYEYPTNVPAPYNNPSDAANYIVSPYASAEQNPPYDVSNIDSWGKYRHNGANRIQRDRPWVNQAPESSEFDPAAWHLKRIILPTGGELHVQYEQHEYAYVQNRPVMAMVSLLPASGSSQGDDLFELIGQKKSSVYQRNNFKLNLADMGVSSTPTNAELAAISNKINELFILGKEKLYFKFLYKLSGAPIACPAELPSECTYEYIRGYAKVYSCTVNESEKAIYVSLGKASTTGVESGDQPLHAAYEFKRSNNPGPDGYGDCDMQTTEIPAGSDIEVVKSLSNKAQDIIDGNKRKTGISNPSGNNNVWQEQPKLVPCFSYLRIPMTTAKRGGGVRVKRLLMLNPAGALETHNEDAMLYGTEYLYETFENGKKISSGVATNEPGAGREENALVRLMYDDINTSDEVIAGENIVQYEGPLGESLLPGPSIGYSRVVARSIHKGITNPGFSVYEYYTVREYPSLQVLKTDMKSSSNGSNPIISWLSQQFTDVVSATQGFSLISNHMHGQIKSVCSYGGSYNEEATTLQDALPSTPTTSQEYEYVETGKPVPVMYAADKPLRMEHPGREMEVVFDARRVTDLVRVTPLQASVAFASVTPLFSGMVYFNRTHNELRTHVMTKIIDNPVILQRVKKRRDGVESIVENVAFDAASGAPVVTRTTDGHSGLSLPGSSPHQGTYYSYTIPAHMYYPDMGQKAAAERLLIQSKDAKVPTSWSYPHVKVMASGTVSPTARPSGTGSALLFQFDNPAGSGYSSAEVLHDARGKLAAIKQTLRPGDIVELKAEVAKTIKLPWPQKPVVEKKTESRGVFYIKDVIDDIAGSTPLLQYNLSDPHYGSAVPSSKTDKSLLDVSIVEVLYSARANSLGALGESIVTYGNDIQNAVGYAQKLFSRDIVADKLNGWLAQGGWGNSVSYERDFTWKFGVSGAYDLINDMANQSKPVADFNFQLSRQGNTVEIGWWNTKKDPSTVIDPVTNLPKVVYHPGWHSVGSTTYKQSFPYTGKEYFGINDDGKLVYYTAINGQTTAVNVDFQFRNIETTPQNPSPPPPHTLIADGGVAYPLTTPGGSVSGVLAAQAMTYSDDWSYAAQDVENYGSPTGRNAYEIGERGKWRSQYVYTYRAPITGGARDYSADNERAYKNSGVYTLSGLLNRTTPPALVSTLSTGWVRLNNNPSAYPSAEFIEKEYSYTPHGESIQQADILNIPSSVRFAHKGIVPAITANNAEYVSIAFSSFEESDPSTASYRFADSHTGKYSCQINGTTYTYDPHVRITGRTRSAGLSIRFWLSRGQGSLEDIVVNVPANSLAITVTPSIGGASLAAAAFTTQKIARTGEWELYEVLLPSSSLSSVEDGKAVGISFQATPKYLIDDIRIQPVDATATCYVYDPNTMRLLTTLDDQHFGLTYQYNAEGIPLRAVKETVEGYKTISESVFHQPRRLDRATYASGGGAYSSGAFGGGSSAPMLLQDVVPLHGTTGNPGQQLDGKLNLLDINVSPDKRTIDVLGNDSLARKAEEEIIKNKKSQNDDK